MKLPTLASRSIVALCSLVALTSLSTVSSVTSGVAFAADPLPASVNAEIMVMHATQEASGSIDAQIGAMPQLTKPPFSAYNTYKLLDRKTVSVERGKATSYALPNGRTLQLGIEALPEKQYKVTASVNRAEGGAFLKLLEVKATANEPFFVAGQTHGKGVLVFAITVRP
jgi:hypothetical protein